MKRLCIFLSLAVSIGLSNQVLAQGTAFSYQGELQVGGAPANGGYDFIFALYNDPLVGSQIGNTVTNKDVGVTNGLFLAAMDFGSSPWTGQALWLQILVSPTGSQSFTPLMPRQAFLSTPYAVQALNAATASTAATATTATTAQSVAAANVTGTLSAPQLPANLAYLGSNQTFLNQNSFSSNVTIKAASGAALTVNGNTSGGFGSPVVLIQNTNTAVNAGPALRVIGYGTDVNGVLSVSSQGTGLLAQFGNANTFVAQLDTNGNWIAAGYTGSGAGLTNLNASQLTSGTVPLSQLPSAVVTNNAPTVSLSGTFNGTLSGNGSGVTSLNASQLTSGTIPDARQSTNVDLLNATQTVGGAKTFTSTVNVNVNTGSGEGMVVQGDTFGGIGSPAMLVQNNFNSASAGPALRVVSVGGSSSSVLSVSSQANTGLLADFGNPNAFVSWLDYNGNWTANSFTGDGAGLTGVNANSVGGTQLTSGPNLGVNTNVFLNNNPVYLRSDINHGLAYNGPGVTNFPSGSVLPDGPVLWGYTGGALGVLNGGAASALSWNNSAVTVANGLNVGGNAAVSGTLSAANTPGVNFIQTTNYSGLTPGGTNALTPITIGQNQNVGFGSMGNFKPAPGYFVIMVTVNAEFNNVTTGDSLILELSDVTSGSELLNTASYTAKSGYLNDDNGTISLSMVVPTSPGGGFQNFGIAGDFFCPSGSGASCTVANYNMTVMYFPRLND